MAVLDSQGLNGTPAPLPLPNNPFIVGLNVWSAGAVLNLATAKFVAATPTINFQLQ
jgi:hypothetical protein